ncbi:hypothetical protein ACMFMF_005643 [Clarireedia jacksonii]
MALLGNFIAARIRHDYLGRRHEIRLLKIIPGCVNEDLLCQLKVVSLDQRPKYNTLSYTWGHTKDITSISVDGQMVQVSKNLCIALRAVRHPWKAVTFWADALCIDQANDDEKSKQVPMMGRIYEQRQQTWISLGSPNEIWAQGNWSPTLKTEESMDIVKRLIRGVWRLFWHHIVLRRSRPSRLGINYVSDSLRLVLSLESKDKIEGQPWENEAIARSMLKWIVTHEYWNRVWILQEVALSIHDPICIFGIHQIPLLSLETILSNWRRGYPSLLEMKKDFAEPKEWVPEMTDAFDHACDICMLRDEFTAFSRFFRRGHHMNLLRSMQFASDRKASLALDHVYGIHSLLSLDEQKSLPVNYNLSVRELYASVTKLILHKEKSAAILCAAVGMNSKNEHGLASWVLDLSKPLKVPALQDGIKEYNFPSLGKLCEPDTLLIEGVYVGDCVNGIQVQGLTSKNMLDKLDLVSSLHGPQELEDRATEMVCHFLNADSRTGQRLDLKAFLNILTANIYKRAVGRRGNRTISLDDTPPVNLGGLYERCEKLLANDQTHILGQDAEDLCLNFLTLLALSLEEHVEFSEKLCSGRIFRTHGGRVGKCAGQVQINDEIWVLPSTKTAFVFRPSIGQIFSHLKTGDDDKYHLVGPCICSNMTVEFNDAPDRTTQYIKII